jgi:hypothetical protein
MGSTNLQAFPGITLFRECDLGTEHEFGNWANPHEWGRPTTESQYPELQATLDNCHSTLRSEPALFTSWPRKHAVCRTRLRNKRTQMWLYHTWLNSSVTQMWERAVSLVGPSQHGSVRCGWSKYSSLLKLSFDRCLRIIELTNGVQITWCCSCKACKRCLIYKLFQWLFLNAYNLQGPVVFPGVAYKVTQSDEPIAKHDGKPHQTEFSKPS